MSQPYQSLEASLHDVFWAEEDDASELLLMEEFLKEFPGRALEVGCGSGRLLFPLLARGHDVEGLELSEDMLRLAETRAALLGHGAMIHHGAMETWKPQTPYHAVMVPAFTLQLASAPGSTLKNLMSMLEARGGLYLTVFTPLAELDGELPENEWYEDHYGTLPDGRRALLETRHTIDPDARLLHREHRYSVIGQKRLVEETRQTIRWFAPGELETMLTILGFEILHIWHDFHLAEDAMPDQDDTLGIRTISAVLRV